MSNKFVLFYAIMLIRSTGVRLLSGLKIHVGVQGLDCILFFDYNNPNDLHFNHISNAAHSQYNWYFLSGKINGIYIFSNVTCEALWELHPTLAKIYAMLPLNCKTCQPHKNVLSHKIQQWENGICGILIYLLVHVLPVDMLLEHSPNWKVMPLYFVALDTCISQFRKFKD